MADNSFETLERSAALALWLKGKEAWNKWVNKNPNYNIDFCGADFLECALFRFPDIDVINFSGFHFPNGTIDFTGSNFGNRDVSFVGAKFGDGDVYFNGASFGDGRAAFNGTSFGNGDVYFSNAKFGKGETSFTRARFGSGRVDFIDASFGDGDVFFIAVDFGDGDASFFGAEFGSGQVNFSQAKFGKGKVDFSCVNFGAGKVIFNLTRFGSGDVYFNDTDFGAGNVVFNGAYFGSGEVSFYGAKFKGCIEFSYLSILSRIKSFSFKCSTFDGPLVISSVYPEGFPCLVDLTHTKASHHVSLDGLKCTLPRKKNRESKFCPEGDWATQKIAIDPRDQDRARRLKELAEANKDHFKAKEFQIMEWQSARTHKYPFDFLFKTEFWYEKLSDYGRSIMRPLGWMGFIWFLWAEIYMVVSAVVRGVSLTSVDFYKPAVYSAAQMFAFLPNSRIAIEKIGHSLFCTEYCKRGSEAIFSCANVPEWLYVITSFQNLIAFVLLFLVGLGIRFRYRI